MAHWRAEHKRSCQMMEALMSGVNQCIAATGSNDVWEMLGNLCVRFWNQTTSTLIASLLQTDQ